MDEKRFLQGLKYLNAYYTNFNFNINDDYKIGVWYGSVKHIDGDMFSQLVKEYCDNNVYPPQSPAHLLDYAKTVLISNSMSSDSAWTYAIDLLRRVGYDFSRFYTKCEYDIISQIINDLRADLVGIHTDKLPFVKKRFVELYDKALEQEAKNTIKEGKVWGTQVLLSKVSHKMLE